VNDESFGCELPMKTRFSPEEQRSVDLVEPGTRRKNAGHEIPLLWKDGQLRLTNRIAAERRFVGFFRRFVKDPVYDRLQNYDEQVFGWRSGGLGMISSSCRITECIMHQLRKETESSFLCSGRLRRSVVE